MLAEQVNTIRNRIADACARANRKPQEVTLIAVSKTFGTDEILGALGAGISDIGESYVQELRKKHEILKNRPIRWHFVGHLQSNKVKTIAPWISCIHAVDSHSLALEISRQAVKGGRTIEALIEVNAGGEASKFGVKPEECLSLARQVVKLDGVRLTGLMTIGPFSEDPEFARPVFRTLRDLRDELERDGIHAPQLSMGMTNDFEAAIEEGSTMIRIGTGLFGDRPRKGTQAHENHSG